ncbi:MAG: SH3 domain-containing protein [Chloroflexota bacterium]
MTHTRNFRYFFPFIVLVLFSLACITYVAPAGPAAPPPDVPDGFVLVTATPVGGNGIVFVTATPTPVPPTATPTLTSTPTPTPTPTSTLTRAEIIAIELVPGIPSIVADTDLNVRTGPGLGFQRLGILPPGTTVEVIGAVADGSWWQIRYPESATNSGWVADGFGTGQFLDEVPIVTELPPASPVLTATPIVANAQPVQPIQPTVVSNQSDIASVASEAEQDFVIIRQRLRSNEENGGVSQNGSAINCGFGHEINVLVVDAGGSPLNGVIIGDTYNNPKKITGSHGPGRTQYVLFVNGYNLLVVEDQSADRAVTSETSTVMSAKDFEIPIPWLIEGQYCANEEECNERVSKNGLCLGHYSYDITFQRQW